MEHGETEVLERKVDEANAEDRHGHRPKQKVKIKVNTKPVVMVGLKHTGLQIKQAAIAQGVKIELDFVLSVIRGHGNKGKVVGDNETITLHDDLCFTAVADDDNS